jgi:hypothetical protein
MTANLTNSAGLALAGMKEPSGHQEGSSKRYRKNYAWPFYIIKPL